MKKIASKVFQWLRLKPREINPYSTIPDNAWNRFVNYATTHDLEEVQPEVRPVFLVFWYMSEVENGGHLQYFINRCDDPFEMTVKALHDMGSTELASTLEIAVLRWNSADRDNPQSVEEYVSLALEEEFETLDNAIYKAVPSISELLDANLPNRFSITD